MAARARAPRRALMRRRRAAPRRRTVARIPRAPRTNGNIAQQTKLFKWYRQLWTWSTVATSDFWRNYTISLADAPNYANYTAMFEKYRINWIKFTFYPQFDSVNMPVSTTATPLAGKQYLVTAANVDNTVVPSGTYAAASLNLMMASQQTKVHQFNKPIKILIRGPKVLEDVTAAISSKSVTSPWLFTTASGSLVTHNACQAFWYQSGFDATPGATYADVHVSMSVTFKDLKL